tara:strand:+ start:1979 stop:2785 length:807 start_codon:yes stop_codon:yes gene_type:complete
MNYILNQLKRNLFKILYKSIYIYKLALIIIKYNNFLLPHEEDLWGLKYLKFRKKDIIDIGASDGLCFKSIKYLGFKNNYIAFEVLRQNESSLKKIKEKNLNFKYNIVAIGNKNSQLKIFTPKYRNFLLNNWSSYSKKQCIKNLKLRKFKLNFEELKFINKKIYQRKLDFFKLRPFFIKIDVEGYEKNVLLGSLKTIKKHLPIISVENNSEEFYSNTIIFYKKKLKQYGYRPYIFNFDEKKFFEYDVLTENSRIVSYNVFFLKKNHFIN